MRRTNRVSAVLLRRAVAACTVILCGWAIGGAGPGHEGTGSAVSAVAGRSQRVVQLPGGPGAPPRAILVDREDRVWVGHDRGVAVHEAGSWRDASAGLAASVVELHETPAGEIFASGGLALWRREGETWTRLLEATSCIAPLRLGSRGPVLLGVCSYYPYYVRWPSREPQQVEVAAFFAGIPDDLAVLEDGEVYVISAAGGELLRLPADGDFRDEDAWLPVRLPGELEAGTRLTDLWSPGPGRLVVVGERGLVLSLSEGSWSIQETGVDDHLLAVWGTAAEGIYAVGHGGRIIFRDAEGWRTLAADTDRALVAVHGRPGGRIAVAGTEGAVFEILR